jgi:beta-lactamase class C
MIVTRLVALTAMLVAGSVALAADDLERIVERNIRSMLSSGGEAGAAVAIRIDGRATFLNYGFADRAAKRPMTEDSLFSLASLRKVFEATLLAQAVGSGDLGLDDPVHKYVTELNDGGDIRRVTLGQLATHTSGLLLPQDHPPWPDWGYTLPEFIRTLNAWKAEVAPGTRHLYTHAGFVLLQLALERRYETPIDELIERRITKPLGMNATSLPRRDESARGQLVPEQKNRAVQGYDEDGAPVGKPGEQQGYYHWAGTSQMFSSPRDMAVFLAANLGELPLSPSLQAAMALAQRPVLRIGPSNLQALAWEIVTEDPAIVEKYGGLNNASAYVGMMQSRKLGIVILSNRGNHYPSEHGRRIMLELARR